MLCIVIQNRDSHNYEISPYKSQWAYIQFHISNSGYQPTNPQVNYNYPYQLSSDLLTTDYYPRQTKNNIENPNKIDKSNSVKETKLVWKRTIL